MISKLFALIFLIAAILGTLPGQTSGSVSDQLRAALQSDDLESVQRLLDSGVDPNLVRDEFGFLIPEAAIAFSKEALTLLLRAGANPNIVDEQGYSAVMRALEFGRVDNARVLHKFGASLKGISNDGYTVRLLAERVGLMDFGPAYESDLGIEVSQEDANLLLLKAAEAGDLPTVKFAIEQGANRGTKAKNGWTPIMLAALGAHNEVFEHFLDDSPFEWSEANHSVGNVDLVVATLIGGDGGNDQKAKKILDYIERLFPAALASSNQPYREIAQRLKLSSTIVNMFPERLERLPVIETQMPVGMPESKEAWKEVQRVLQSEGLYAGAIDGVPGPQTYRGLYAYHEPFIEVLRKNCELTAQRALNAGNYEQNQDLTYGNAVLRDRRYFGELNTKGPDIVLNGFAVSKGKDHSFCRLTYGPSPAWHAKGNGMWLLEGRIINQTEQLPAGAGRISNVVLQVLKYHVLSDSAVGGREVATAPKPLAPVSLSERWKLAKRFTG